MCNAIKSIFKKLAVFLMVVVLLAGGVSLVRADESSDSPKPKPKTSAEAKKSGEKKSSEKKTDKKKSDEKKGSAKKDDSGSKKPDNGKAKGRRMGGMGGGGKTKPK